MAGRPAAGDAFRYKRWFDRVECARGQAVDKGGMSERDVVYTGFSKRPMSGVIHMGMLLSPFLTELSTRLCRVG